MKNKGFTLTELLAVIVILGILAVIVIPSVQGIMRSSKEKAYQEQINSLEKMARDYSVNHELGYEDDIEKALTFETLRASGLLSGEVKDPRNGEVLKGCVVYKWLESDQQYHFEYREDCYVEAPPLPVEITFTPETNKINEKGWSKENFYVSINAMNASKYKWCGSSNQTCEPVTEVNGTTGNVNIISEGNTTICVIGYNSKMKPTEKICSDIYKLDKTNPSFTGIEDITVNVGGSVNLTSGVNVSDSLSGISGPFTYNPTTINTNKTGSYPVVYHVEDNAGNIKEITRNVIVNSNNPTIHFTATSGSINGNGWANSNFYVTVNSTDYSGHGIEKIVWCGTTSNTCTPTTEVNGANQNVLISQESSSNRICAYAIDKGGHTGSSTCSDAYKLDKKTPLLTRKNTSTELAPNTSYNLPDDYLTINPNGISAVSQSQCIDSSDNNKIVTNTSSLSIGNHAITCTTTKQNGLSSSETIHITIKEPYTGIPDITYNERDLITYGSLEWKVIKSDAKTVTMILANNYKTGNFGTTTNWSTSNAYQQVNTNFLNDYPFFKEEINLGGIILDTQSNSYVRLPYYNEITNHISNNSNTYFWTMSAQDNQIRYATEAGNSTVETYTIRNWPRFRGYSAGEDQIKTIIPSCYTENTETLASPTVTSVTLNTNKTETSVGYYATGYAETMIGVERIYEYCSSSGPSTFSRNTVNSKQKYYYAYSAGCNPNFSCSVSATSHILGIRPVITVNKK